MLEEAVRKMKGEADKPAHAGTVINLGISVRIDADYIPEENQRLRMYKRIAGAEDFAALADVRAELQDRYGTPPEAVLNLLAAAEIRLQCEQLGIAQMDRKRTQVEIGPPKVQGTGRNQIKVQQKGFIEMLNVKFVEKQAGGAPATAPGVTPVKERGVEPGVLMRLVSRNAKRGAQFTPQGVLRWPLSSAKAEDVLAETRALLDALEGARTAA
jgi:transcription-repair coupling factor (superfamily II helicase)